MNFQIAEIILMYDRETLLMLVLITCSSLIAVGGYPQSGYAELDSALLPPNGQDPYRNTPSPGLHGVPQDRYG